MKNALTPRQQEILDFVKEFTRQNQMPPALKDIAAHFHIRCSSAAYHLEALRRKKWLDRIPGARGIILKEQVIECSPEKCCRKVPVRRDSNDLPQENIYLFDEHLMLCPPKRVIAFRMEDDSMFEMGIHNGDTIIAIPLAFKSCYPGDIVYAELPDGTHLVRTYSPCSLRQFELVPANADFPVRKFSYTSNVIKAVVITLVRHFWEAATP